MRILIAAAAVLLTASVATAEDTKVAPAPQTTTVMTTTVTTTGQAGEAALTVAPKEVVKSPSNGYEGCHGRRSAERLIM
ncbi:MAG: hypothetical protein AB7E66_02650 [Parvibaculaceae bacterium]